MNKLKQLEISLGYQFNDDSLLELALTHRSAGQKHNERLEFLGDAILGFTIADILFRRFPEAREGQLSRLRSNLVKGKSLASLGSELGLGEHLRLGSGELKSGGHRRESTLADAVEAIIGAVYTDSGIEQARACIIRWYGRRLDTLSLDAANKDSKTRLQEYLQAEKQPLPVYEIIATSGEAHNQTFHIMCRLDALDIKVEGRGSSRRKAEQEAADNALRRLGVG